MGKKNYSFFIGVDISKNTLDFAINRAHVLLSHHRIENQTTAIQAFINTLKAIKGLTRRNTVFGMENTGIYGSHIIECLVKLKYDHVVEHPLHLKQTLGLTRGKTDKVDAERIASYLYKHRETLRLHEKRRKVIDQLSSLVTLRERLIILLSAITVPLKEDSAYISKSISQANIKLCTRSFKAIKIDLEEIEQTIKSTWKADENLYRLMQIILSVPSVGEITALKILITTNEFKDISDAKKFACYAGVAPFPRKSGVALNVGGKVSKMANKKMKSLLHICAISASIHSPDIKAYFKRKTIDEGKHKMLVYNAIRFKLICRVFSCVNNNRLYIKDYTHLEVDAGS